MSIIKVRNAANTAWLTPSIGTVPALHVLASTTGLGAEHSTSGLTVGQVLRATGATTMAMQSLIAADIPALAYEASGAIATHAALATGVHGVGASTVASVANIATHAALITGVHGLVFTAGKTLTLTEALTLNALPIGGLAVATAANTLGSLAVGATTQILVGGGAGTIPAWGADLPTAVTIGSAYIYRASGTDVAVADGGTGASTFALNGVLFGNATSAIGVTAIGAQYNILTVGATPFVPVFSGFLLDGTTGGKTILAVTNTKVLTLTAADSYNLTIPATGTAALLNQANSFTLGNPLTTIAESWIGPSSTAGIYFNGGKVGIGTTGPRSKLHVGGTQTDVISLGTTNYGGSSGQALAGLSVGQDGDGAGGILNLQTLEWGGGLYDLKTRVTINQSGNVGIGTTAPGSLLEVKSTSGNGAILTLNHPGTADYGATYLQENGVNVGYLQHIGSTRDVSSNTYRLNAIELGTSGTGSIEFRPHDVLAMIINDGGNTGIGTPTPRKLADFLSTSQSQLRLTYTDNSVYSDFTVGSGGNLTVAPTGDFIFDPVGNDILPNAGYDLNIGSLSKKYLTFHAAELWVETLVAQYTIATIGGRVVVGPTTMLTVDLGDAVGDTTITVKHNEMTSGDRVYLEANGFVEFMSIDSAAGGSAGAFTYTVTRDLDGTGRNLWYAGDAILNTGTTGDGFIDIYSYRSVKSATQYGPAIVGNIRNSATYNDWTEHWAIGNLNGVYGYGATTYGAAFGKYAASNSWIAVDATNGIRIVNGTGTVIGQWSTAGVITVGQVAASQDNILISSGALDIRNNTTARIHLAADGSGYLASTNISWTSAGILTAGGWVIGATSLADAAGVVGMSSAVTAGDDIRFWAGHATPASAPFRVTEAGVLTASSGAIGGWRITATGIDATNMEFASGATPHILIGGTSYTSDGVYTDDGIGIDQTGLYGVHGGVNQAYINATGQLLAGAGKVVIDVTGIRCAAGTVWNDSSTIQWYTSSTDYAAIGQYVNVGTDRVLVIDNSSPGTQISLVDIRAICVGGFAAEVTVEGNSTTSHITANAKNVEIVGGLNIGAAALGVSGAAPGAIMLKEITAPSAPGTNMATLYIEDDGTGKTHLMIRFQSGIAQEMALEV